MRHILGLLAVLALIAGCAQAPPLAIDLAELRKPPSGTTLWGAFEGKVPCSGCERVKVAITLHQHSGSGEPASYVLELIHVGRGDERAISTGSWTRSAPFPSAAGPTAIVRLDASAPALQRTYLAVGQNILLMLDERLEPQVGDPQHGFTLSRIG